ncbi:MAG TPA: AIR synthase-related protein, partial [Candidatus Udaeobacter sp.]|nr:AIR synthase-related protein [Candidatus Udaeobacter sp.]
IDLKTGDMSAATALFNESQSRIVISVAPENAQKAMSILQERQIPFQQFGRVGGNQLRIRLGSEEFSWPVTDLYDDWWNAIRRAVESDSGAERIPSL